LPIAVDADFERFIAARRALLNERLVATDVKAKGGLLADVVLDKGVPKITPIEKSTTPEAETLATCLYAMLPRIRITDLLSEGGEIEAVHGVLHPSTDRRNRRRSRQLYGEHPSPRAFLTPIRPDHVSCGDQLLGPNSQAEVPNAPPHPA
jgi:hypothetical protein